MNYTYEIKCLSSKFIHDYPLDQYPELMSKLGRPYNCLLVDTHMDFKICLPFRSSIKHKNAFIFHKSKRSKATQSGIDYSKMILINDMEYLDSSNAVVDQDEYKETVDNISQIVEDAVNYLDVYINHINNRCLLHFKNFKRAYQYSSLKYFHDILKIK